VSASKDKQLHLIRVEDGECLDAHKNGESYQSVTVLEGCPEEGCYQVVAADVAQRISMYIVVKGQGKIYAK